MVVLGGGVDCGVLMVVEGVEGGVLERVCVEAVFGGGSSHSTLFVTESMFILL